MLKSRFQLFIENSVLSFLTLVKVVILSKYFLKLRLSADRKKKCIILGNSPSLERTILANPGFMEDKDSFAVNFFWKSELYKTVRPRFYVIVSTSYWSKNQIVVNAEDRKVTFQKIAELTKWKMTLLVPALAQKHTQWKNEISENKNIDIVYFNPTPVEGFTSINHLLFRTNLGMPRPHNVLIPSIKLAIDMQYSEIYILGAEHSWLKDIYVADNNVVYVSQKHFYNEKTAKPEVMTVGSTNQERTLGEMLTKFVHTFNSYFVLKGYAASKKIKIFNATKDSYIDAFDRIQLED